LITIKVYYDTSKEIVYTSHRKIAVIVAEGEYKGVKYVCVNRGIHPCAYIFCTQEFLDKHESVTEIVDNDRVIFECDNCGAVFSELPNGADISKKERSILN
jgi:hypothetical protein